MTARWRWLLTLFSRKLWLRVTVIATMGIAAAVAGILLAPYVPDEWTIKIGAQSIDGILDVLASSMLAVTVFSLSTTVAAYSAATTNVTPRATRLLMEDNTSQNVLGTFIGSFLFSLVGIVALSTGLYGSQGRAILLVATIGLIALISITILRWIDYLARYGRLGETIDRVERATWDAMEARLDHPHLGGSAMNGGVPAHASPIFARAVGYVQHVDVAALERCAKARQCEIFVTALPGAFADPSRPVAMIAAPPDEERRPDEEFETEVGNTFTIGAERTFDQDPRFGLCVLAEIGSRALSPAVNDPGTAIDVIGRAVRLLVRWSRFQPPERDDEVAFPNVRVPAIEVDDMFDDIFGPVARDGAGMLEIHMRLQKAFLALATADRHGFCGAARRHSAISLQRGESALTLESERNVVRALAAKVSAIPFA